MDKAVVDRDAAVSVVLVCAPRSRTPAALAVAGVDLRGRTADAGEAVRLVVRHAPQVTVVDLAGGLDVGVVAALVRARPAGPVLAVSGHRDAGAQGPAAVNAGAEGLAAVRAGAAGYLVRPGSAAELVAAVRRTAAGEAVFSAGLADLLLEAQGGPSAVVLTERESDVLRLVVEGLTARQIATRLVLSPRTVENHVHHMQGKLGLRGRAALVRYAIEHGLA